MKKILRLTSNIVIRLLIVLTIIAIEVVYIKIFNIENMLEVLGALVLMLVFSFVVSSNSHQLLKLMENLFFEEKIQEMTVLMETDSLLIENDKNITKEDFEHKQLVAIHEAGHAVICLYFNIPVTNVDINFDIDNNRYGQITYSFILNTLEKMEKAIMISLAGHIAESMKYKKVSSGSSNDIFDATKLINALIKEHGYLEKYGLLNLTIYDFEMFFEDSQILAKEFESRTKSVLEEKWQLVEIIAEQLLNRKKLGKEDLEEIYSAYLESLSDKNEKNN